MKTYIVLRKTLKAENIQQKLTVIEINKIKFNKYELHSDFNKP